MFLNCQFLLEEGGGERCIKKGSSNTDLDLLNKDHAHVEAYYKQLRCSGQTRKVR